MVIGRVRRVAASLAAWVLGAAVAVSVGLLALSLVGNGLVGTGFTADRAQPVAVVTPVGVRPPSPTPPVSSTPSRAGTRSAAPSPAAAGGSPSAPGPATVAARVLSTGAGSVLAGCSDGSAYLISWSPGQGYRVTHVRPGPADEAEVRFSNGETDARIEVVCERGVPRLADRNRDDDGGNN